MTLWTTRRSEWLPGVALLGAAVGISILLGASMGILAWPVYVGLTLGVLLLVGWIERLWTARRSAAPPVPRARGKLKVLQGGRSSAYDLEKDDSTDSQRWLM